MKYNSSGRIAKKGEPNQRRSLVQWQEKIFTFILKAICIAALPPLIKSDISAVKDQLWVNLAAYNLSYLIWCLLIIVKKIPFKVRAWAGMGVLCSLGILSIFSIGPLGSGLIWLYSTTIFATLVLGMRAGVSIMLGQSFCLAVCYYLLQTREDFWTRFIVLTPDSWATTSITLVFLNIVSVLAMGRLIKGLALSLEESEKMGAKLKDATKKLERQISRNDETIQSLKESEERWHFALDGAGDGVWDWDVSNDRVFFSPQWKHIFGYKDEEVRENINLWFDRIMPEDREPFDRVLDQVFNESGSGAFKTQHRIVCGDKTIKWVLSRGMIVQRSEDGTSPVRIIGTHTDITAMKDLENKQREYESRFQQSYKMEAIGTLAGGIAHDFNNLLFPIIGNAELLRADTDNGDSSTRHCLDQIYQSAIRAKELVQQILTFSRHEETAYRPIIIQPIVKETVKMLRSTIPKHIDIRQVIDPDCQAVNADATQIHQIIMNLVTNAYHAIGNAPGELSIQLSTCQIEKPDSAFMSMAPGKFVCLSVFDTGGGIAPENQKKIFDPFFTSKEKGRGTGMGLAVVHGIVKKMNGGISVYSEPGHGSEFKICLPVAENQQIEAKQDEKMSSAFLAGTERILLVDDEKAILSMEKMALEKKGYRVTTQIDPVNALDLFCSTPDEFDLVISDMSMPRMPGHKLAQELLKVRPDIPIIICTGFSENFSLETAVKMGVKDVLHKPVQIKHLLKKIRTLLDNLSSPTIANP